MIPPMLEHACRKCGQVVVAEKTPHSCPRCYSPASEAYVSREDQEKSAELMFDVGTAFDGAPDWENHLQVPDSDRAPAPDPSSSEPSMELDEDDFEAATDRGSQRARPAVPVPGSAAVTTQELDGDDIEALIVARRVGHRTAPPPTPLPVPPTAPVARAARAAGRETARSTAEMARRTAPATRPQRPLRTSRGTVPPTQQVEPVEAARPRRQPTAQQPSRRRRMPTAQTERVVETVRAQRQRRWLLVLWSFGGLVLLIGILRMFVFTGTTAAPRPGSATAVVSMADLTTPPRPLDAAAPADLATKVAVKTSDATLAGRDAGAGKAAPPATAPATKQAQASTKPVASPKPGKPLVVSKPAKPVAVTKPAKPLVARKPTKPPKVAVKPTKPRKPEVKAATAVERRALAQRFYQQGVQKLLLGQTRGSIAQFKEALRADRRFALAYRGLGLAHQKLGQKTAARAAYSRYLGMQPGASDAASIRARIETLR